MPEVQVWQPEVKASARPSPATRVQLQRRVMVIFSISPASSIGYTGNRSETSAGPARRALLEGWGTLAPSEKAPPTPGGTVQGFLTCHRIPAGRNLTDLRSEGILP